MLWKVVDLHLSLSGTAEAFVKAVANGGFHHPLSRPVHLDLLRNGIPQNGNNINIISMLLITSGKQLCYIMLRNKPLDLTGNPIFGHLF